MPAESKGNAPSVASLCMGYGGLDMALEDVLGARTVWCSEIDKHACTVIEARYPHVANHGDLKLIDWAEVEPVDILTAGYPCQPFSHAGLRKGTDDLRHLWPYIADAVRVLRPRLVVLENVAGHVSLGFDTVLGDLAAIGFDAEWVVVRASDVGACHQRARLFVVAADSEDGVESGWSAGDGERAPVGVTAARAGSGDRAGRAAAGVRDLGRGARPLRASAADAGGERHGGGQDGRVVGRLGTAAEGKRRHASAARSQPVDRGEEDAPDSDRRRRSERSEPYGREDGPGLEAPRRDDADRLVEASADPDDFGCEGAIAVAWRNDSGDDQGPSFGEYGPAVERHARALGRPAPSPVDDQGRLAPPFVEWMMMLPAGWVTDLLPRNPALKALGNGVVPAQAAHAIRHLLTREDVLHAG